MFPAFFIPAYVDESEYEQCSGCRNIADNWNCREQRVWGYAYVQRSDVRIEGPEGVFSRLEAGIRDLSVFPGRNPGVVMTVKAVKRISRLHVMWVDVCNAQVKRVLAMVQIKGFSLYRHLGTIRLELFDL